MKQKQAETLWELYNLDGDPLELENLAETMPDKVKELAAIWESESKRLVDQAKLE